MSRRATVGPQPIIIGRSVREQVTTGWRKHGTIGVTEVPARARKLYPTREEWLGMAE